MQDCMRRDQPDGGNKEDEPVASNIPLKSLKAEPFVDIVEGQPLESELWGANPRTSLPWRPYLGNPLGGSEGVRAS